MEDENGATPRRLADLNHRSDVVAILDQWKSHVSDEFVRASERGDLAAVKNFCENTSISYGDRVRILRAAVERRGNAEIVAYLLETYGYNSDDLEIEALELRGSVPNDEHLGGCASEMESLLLSRTLNYRINQWSEKDLNDFAQRVPKFNINQIWSGRTALHQIAEFGGVEGYDKARVLLEMGADPSIKSDTGHTAEQLAKRLRLNDIAALMSAHARSPEPQA